jgi:hypothetical protein
MLKKRFALAIFLLASLPLMQRGAGWEWQFSVGPWTLEPWTSPVERQAEKIVGSEAWRLLAPLLSDFTVIAFEPRVEMGSRGYSANIGCWRNLARDRLAIGAAVSYIHFALPFTLKDERDIYFQGIPLAHVATSGQGQIDLKSFMLTALARWRLFYSGKTTAYAGLGLTLLRLSGDLYLPVSASLRSILGTAELKKTEDMSLAELRKENDEVPPWVLSPALTASLHYRLGAGIRLILEISLSQGTALAAGVSWGR